MHDYISPAYEIRDCFYALKFRGECVHVDIMR
ncbi:MAG: hypothetical protein Hyperionvirus4_157 [Hyperionvirus sp.]|uniref:Uncharacterized protein n=1 Tax=Hyperionvirus sp. TaxID=2487770 RepID=A0A3G5A814_9VIRU|nr:MAG: hypothetical protein Hyperionvirus4_157 [Hyperionvirus sp.]